MNIKTITSHDVCNYGASLQAYALVTFLKQQGHDARIIDYLPDYKPPRHLLTYFFNSGYAAKVYRVAPFLKPLMALWQNRGELKFQKRRRAFDRFKAAYLDTTEGTYHNIGELNRAMAAGDDLKADLYIAGSDQIWNPYYGNGRDPAYFCDFVGSPDKCISYAASFGRSEIEANYMRFIKSRLANFRALSVREKTGVEMVRGLGFDAVQVVDPVFLLGREDWQRLCQKPEEEGYVLVYDFLHNDPRIKRMALELARKESLRIVSVNDSAPLDYADENVNDAGPLEFINYIRHADHVLASSFHAAAFSTIFERDFYIFPLKGHDNESRMTDFLEMLGLGNRFISGDTPRLAAPIDFADVGRRLKERADASVRWLMDNLK